MLAIFRLYNENLSVRYTSICGGCIGCRETPVPYKPPQMPVYLTDKFSLYNLKMANI
jgi:hypothetical protein